MLAGYKQQKAAAAEIVQQKIPFSPLLILDQEKQWGKHEWGYSFCLHNGFIEFRKQPDFFKMFGNKRRCKNLHYVKRI